MALTPKQQRFVDEYLIDLNATQAAIRAGYSAKTAQEQSARLLSKVIVQEAIAAAQAARSAETKITAADVLRRYWMIATADPNELIEYRRCCCRCCWGEGNLYQRTASELDRDLTKWAAAKRKAEAAGEEVAAFDPLGGGGYDARKPPNPKCPECFGEGVGQAFPKDTRNLSPAARCLYAGVKTTKDGLEIKVHDQHAALTNVARHLGMFVEKRELSGPNGGPVEVKGEHEHTVTITGRIESLAGAFVGAADREADRAEEGDLPGDGAGEPVDPGPR